MRTRLPPILFIPLLILTVSPVLQVQAAENPAPFPQTSEQATAQREQAKILREQAQQHYVEEEAACYRKILVNACIDDARERRTQAIVEARRLDIPAREFQRKFRRNEIEEEKNRQTAEGPARDARQREQAERYRAEEAAKVVKREAKWRKKERQAEENRKKLAKEQAKRQLEKERRAKRQAGQIEKFRHRRQ